MSPHILMMLMFTLGAGTLIAISSSHMLVIWVGLELSTLAILPIMLLPPRPRAVEATTKYFLIQAAAAATLLFAAIINAWLVGQWDIAQMTHPLASTISILALTMKLGLAPTHFWLPEILQGLTLTAGLILSTWQKLAPFTLLMQIPFPPPSLLTSIGILSIVMGGWGGLNQVQLRKILAYSSISHLGWMVLVIEYSPDLALLTLIIYIIMTSSLFLIFKYYKVTTINSLVVASAKNRSLALMTPVILLSLGGLPPLTGFLPKWLVLVELVKQDLPLIAVIAALSSLLSLYFYLRLAYALIMTAYPNLYSVPLVWRLNNPQITLPLAICCSITLNLLPLTPLIYALFSTLI